MNTHRNTETVANEPIKTALLDDRYIQVIQQEGDKTRKAIWVVGIVSICILVLSPLLLAASPVLALILGIGFLSAFTGAFIGKSISRNRERKILNELRCRNDSNVVSLQQHKRG